MLESESDFWKPGPHISGSLLGETIKLGRLNLTITPIGQVVPPLRSQGLFTTVEFHAKPGAWRPGPIFPGAFWVKLSTIDDYLFIYLEK